MIGEERDTERRLDKQLIPQKLRNRRQNLILGTQSLMNAAADVNTALMNTVKYFTLLALAAATLGVPARSFLTDRRPIRRLVVVVFLLCRVVIRE